MARKYKMGKKRIFRRRRGGLFNYSRKPTKVVKNTALQPLAQRYICTMKYMTAAQLNLANSFIYKFNLNSLFDPDRTGVGHQPHGFDQLSGLYNRYRVIGCKYTVAAYSTSDPIRFGVVPTNDDGIIWNNMSDFLETPRAKWAIQMPGGSNKLLKGYVSLPSLMGRNKVQYMTDDRYAAQVSTSPAELALLNIGAGNFSDGSGTVNCLVTLHYIVEWYDIKTQAQS